MKRLQIVALLSVLFMSQIMLSSEQSKSYSNIITDIYQINNSVVFLFEKDIPYCNYAPSNYEESSKDSKVHRYFMPETRIADGVSTSLNMRESEGGVELVLYGQTVSKYMGTRNVSFHVTK